MTCLRRLTRSRADTDDDEDLLGRTRNPHRHRRIRRHRRLGDQYRGRVSLRFGTRLGGRRRRDRYLPVREHGRTGGGRQRQGYLRDHPRTARTSDRGRRPGRVVLHQPDDADRRDRRCGVGASVGHRRRSDDVDTGRGVRGVVSGLAGEVLDHGECHRNAWPDADCVCGECFCTASELGWPGPPSYRSGHSRQRVCRHLLVLCHRAVRRRDDALRGASSSRPARSKNIGQPRIWARRGSM